MIEKISASRRDFLFTAGAAAMVFNTASAVKSVSAAETNPADRDKGLKIGVASYSVRKFPLEKAIEMTKDCGVNYITLKSNHLEFNTDKEQRQEAAKKIKDAGLVLMGGGVIYFKNDEKEIRAMFDYCKDAGMPTMVCAPAVDALPAVEKFVKEYDIKVAIHNHGPGDKLYPSAKDAYKLIKEMDPRMGVCIDIGHSVRIGEDEEELILSVKDRLHDFHIKDVTKREKDGSTVAVGRGVINIPKVLKTLLDIKYAGHLALEYEADENDPVPGMRESFGYMRGVLAVL